ncbi:MAG: Hint domain-containing protein [Proteobacteria bacterium]|nr:Hint domain-containing protein [Pseudomonadota bacterium]
MTGARVRASSRIVGAAARGGSWDVDGVGTPPLTLAGLSAYAGAFNQNLQSVTVTGIADIGQILTATPSFNGNGNQGTLTYQWRYSTNGGSTWITITGATASTFTITAAQQGYIIDVVATQSFGGGNTRTATSNPTGSVACFLAGTLIDTPKGKVPVETLVRGDDVVTSDGKVSPVQWVGRQTVSTTFADPTRVLPIRIKAGAFGDAMPERDLLVSPDHALLVDGVLVHAGALVNGLSIVREHDVPNTFTYYHVELADHSLVLAEGVPAETFIDNVDRMAFDNWAEHEALYPAGAPTMVEMDLPRAKSHRQVPRAIRERLTARAAALFGAVEQAA